MKIVVTAEASEPELLRKRKASEKKSSPRSKEKIKRKSASEIDAMFGEETSKPKKGFTGLAGLRSRKQKDVEAQEADDSFDAKLAAATADYSEEAEVSYQDHVPELDSPEVKEEENITEQEEQSVNNEEVLEELAEEPKSTAEENENGDIAKECDRAPEEPVEEKRLKTFKKPNLSGIKKPAARRVEDSEVINDDGGDSAIVESNETIMSIIWTSLSLLAGAGVSTLVGYQIGALIIKNLISRMIGG